MSRRDRDEEEMSLSSFPLGLQYFLGKWNPPVGGSAPIPPTETFYLLQANGDKILQADGTRILRNG